MKEQINIYRKQRYSFFIEPTLNLFGKSTVCDYSYTIARKTGDTWHVSFLPLILN